MIKFIPNLDFASDEFKSNYVAGLVYRVRPDNKTLAAAVSRWQAEGKVSISKKDHSDIARIGGIGVVA